MFISHLFSFLILTLVIPTFSIAGDELCTEIKRQELAIIKYKTNLPSLRETYAKEWNNTTTKEKLESVAYGLAHSQELKPGTRRISLVTHNFTPIPSDLMTDYHVFSVKADLTLTSTSGTEYTYKGCSLAMNIHAGIFGNESKSWVNMICVDDSEHKFYEEGKSLSEFVYSTMDIFGFKLPFLDTSATPATPVAKLYPLAKAAIALRDNIEWIKSRTEWVQELRATVEKNKAACE